MKIGILTYHRSQNYGALLQAIALRKVLEDEGNDVSFIDYWPDYHRNLYRIIPWHHLRMPQGTKSIYYLLRSLILYLPRKRRSDAFEDFISKYILKHSIPYDEDVAYDTVVYGSDQIWRKQEGLEGEFNPVYFGDNTISAQRSISYAASMGIIHSGEKDRDFIRERLSGFSSLLVRENTLKELLAGCGLEASVVLDPTLLLDNAKWRDMFDLKSQAQPDYLLFYDLQSNCIDYSVIKEYASRKGLRVKVIEGEPHHNKEEGMEYVENADPAKFLELLYNAKAVVTSSYHGLVFSLIFNKDFFAVFTKNRDRAESLLTQLSLQHRMLPQLTDRIPDSSPIDYAKVNSSLQERRSESLHMLAEALSETGKREG